MSDHDIEKNLPFDAVVSLGSHCQVAWQIEHYFGFRFASPFDWLITPFSGLLSAIQTEGKLFAKDISLNESHDVAKCNDYGISYHHEFQRDDQRKIIFTDDAMIKTSEKLTHKYTKLSRLLRERRRVLFIRMNGHYNNPSAWPYHQDATKIDSIHLNCLCTSLEWKFPGLDYRILFVYHPERLSPI